MIESYRACGDILYAAAGELFDHGRAQVGKTKGRDAFKSMYEGNIFCGQNLRVQGYIQPIRICCCEIGKLKIFCLKGNDFHGFTISLRILFVKYVNHGKNRTILLFFLKKFVERVLIFPVCSRIIGIAFIRKMTAKEKKHGKEKDCSFGGGENPPA